jgi:hypothetical protein
MRGIPGRSLVLVMVLGSVVALAACKSDTTSAANGAAPTGAATTAAVQGGGASATFSGDLSGTMTLGLCTGSIGSLQVHVTGDDTKYLGSVSGRSMGFIGPDGGPFGIPTGGQLPTAAADGNSFDVTGVVLSDTTLTQKKITVSGTLHCP